MNILEEIIAHKRIEIEKSKDRLPLDKLKKLTKTLGACHGMPSFYQTIKNQVDKKQIALIAEIKKASPSKGLIRADFNHIEIARSYKKGGATCLSVLTDEKYFQGKLNFIKEIKDVEACHGMPLLRKDFIIDPYQIYESIYFGADCVLLIVGGVPGPRLLRDLYNVARDNEIDTLIEVHDAKEMEIVLNIGGRVPGPCLLGINNRNLKTFETNLNTTRNLVSKYRHDLENKIIVSESGIFTRDDVESLMESGVYAFLVGESLMREKNIEKATRKLINISCKTE